MNNAKYTFSDITNFDKDHFLRFLKKHDITIMFLGYYHNDFEITLIIKHLQTIKEQILFKYFESC